MRRAKGPTLRGMGSVSGKDFAILVFVTAVSNPFDNTQKAIQGLAANPLQRVKGPEGSVEHAY